MRDTRLLVFFFICLGIRSTFAALAATISTDYLWILSIFGFLFVLGWIRIMFFVPRDTGPEAGGKIWWKNWRPVHAVLWLGFSVFAVNGIRESWYFLLADVILGFLLWSQKRLGDAGYQAT
jgi:NADH:ubiquinone oxidoreductase subunit 6 (subunit J)